VLVPAALGLVALVAWLGMAYVGAYGVWRGYDATAHALAGYAIGSIAALPTVAYLSDTILAASVAALVVSSVATFAWEVYEFKRSIYPWIDRTTLALAWDDTGGDAAFVAVGALLAGIVVGLLA